MKKYILSKATPVLMAALALGSCNKNKAVDGGIVYDSSTPPATSMTTTPQAPPASTKHAPGKFGDTTYTASGLGYIDSKVGSGPNPKPGQDVSMNYTGMLTNGKKFDSNEDPNFHHTEPFKFKIGTGQVIAGWDEGIMSMKPGGKRRLIVPSDIGYGPTGNPPDIPGGATLIFDVTMLGVE